MEGKEGLLVKGNGPTYSKKKRNSLMIRKSNITKPTSLEIEFGSSRSER